MSCVPSFVNILWELKLSSVSTMNHLIGLGVCALVCYTNFITYQNDFLKDILGAFLDVQN